MGIVGKLLWGAIWWGKENTRLRIRKPKVVLAFYRLGMGPWVNNITSLPWVCNSIKWYSSVTNNIWESNKRTIFYPVTKKFLKYQYYSSSSKN